MADASHPLSFLSSLESLDGWASDAILAPALADLGSRAEVWTFREGDLVRFPDEASPGPTWVAEGCLGVLEEPGPRYVGIKERLDAPAGLWVRGQTAGRFVTGFVTLKLSNKGLIRTGCLIIAAGLLLMILPLPLTATLTGFLLVGLGCAPIFPCMLHETPVRFGPGNAQAVMGFQMACAYTGTTVLPPAFGFVAQATSTAWMPFLLLGFALLLAVGTEKVRNLKAV